MVAVQAADGERQRHESRRRRAVHEQGREQLAAPRLRHVARAGERYCRGDDGQAQHEKRRGRRLQEALDGAALPLGWVSSRRCGV